MQTFRRRLQEFPLERHLPWSAEEFAEAVKPYLRDVVSAAAAVLGCEHHAWDAVQETLLSLWRETQPPPNLRAWLLRTVRHRSLHLRRTCTRRRRRDLQAAATRSECRCEDDPCRILGAHETALLLKQAGQSLPEDLREVFQLREVENLEYQVIAQRLQVPIGTVRSRLSRSRKALKNHMRQLLSSTN